MMRRQAKKLNTRVLFDFSFAEQINSLFQLCASVC